MGIWKRKSVFMGLPYWLILGTPHCLDVMHITKNVCESLLGTLFNMPDRTKDGPKARNDLMDMNIRKGLHLPSADDRTKDEDEDEEETQGPSKRKKVKPKEWYCPPSCFTLSPNELDRVFQCLL